MIFRAKTIKLQGQVAHRHEANGFLTEPGAAVLVVRGVVRSIAIACPDGCGEQLTVNLDSRGGPAWRLYQEGNQVSLFPSVWRDTGCKSHFIVWRSRIYWCDRHDPMDAPTSEQVASVRAALTSELTPYVAIADALGMVPWAVVSACNLLVKQGTAERGGGRLSDHFRCRP